MPSITQEQRTKVQFEARTMFYGVILHLLTQVTHIHCPWEEKSQRLLSIPVSGLPWFWATYFPASYFYHREPLLMFFKFTWYLFPLLRQPKGIQQVLNAPATASKFGFLLDIVKVAWGTRLFALLYLSIIFPQHILLYTIGQIYSVWMLRMNDSLCSTMLLQDPLMKGRMQTFNMLVSVAFMPQNTMLGTWQLSETEDCSFFLTLLMLSVGVAMPVGVLFLSRMKMYMGAKTCFVAWFVLFQLCVSASVVATSFSH